MESKTVTPKKETLRGSSKGLTDVSSAENQKGIDLHKKAAKHHQEAAKNHLDAAKHHEAGNHEAAGKSTVKAQGHATLASNASSEDAQSHAING